jgi:hypothetical protein
MEIKIVEDGVMDAEELEGMGPGPIEEEESNE